MIELCRHIKPEGTACKGPAVRGTNFCRHHQLIKSTLDKVKPAPDNYGLYKPLPFVFPEDRSAIQTNLFLVLHAFSQRKIDAKSANFMTYNLHVCLSNLSKGGPLAPSDTENSVRRVILTPEGDEIAPPREALEKDESPLHHKDCPCQRCAEQFRGAQPEQHHTDCECGLCEPIIEACHPEAEHSVAEGPAFSEPAEELVLSNAKEPAVNDQRSALRNQETDQPSVSSAASVVKRSARAQALRSTDTLSPLQKEPNYHHYLFGDEIAKHEARYAARARAALEAGLDLPEHTPFDTSTHESESERNYKEWREQIDRNRKAAIDKWNEENPGEPKEFKPFLTWGEEHDLKLAHMKKLREEEAARNAAICSQPPLNVMLEE